MSRLRPVYSCRSTWLNGSSRAPNLLLVRRTPLATARTLPCRRVRTVTIRSASPSFWVRRTTPSSRYSDFGVVDTSVPAPPGAGSLRSSVTGTPGDAHSAAASVTKPVQLLGVVLPLAEDGDVQVQVHPGAEQLLQADPGLAADRLDHLAAAAEQHRLLALPLDVQQGVHLDQLVPGALAVGTADQLLDGDGEGGRDLLAHLLQRRLADQLGDLPLDVGVGGLLLGVHRRPLGQQPDQQVLEQLDLVALHRADRHHLGGVDQGARGHQLLGDLLLARGVGLGDHDDDGGRELAQLAGDEPVAGADGLVGGDAEDDDVDVGEGVADDVVEPAAQQAARLVQSRGVDEHQLPAGPGHHAADGVPRGLRAVADDADLRADHRVGQRGLAGVGTADQAGEAAAERLLLVLGHATSLPPATDDADVRHDTAGTIESWRDGRGAGRRTGGRGSR